MLFPFSIIYHILPCPYKGYWSIYWKAIESIYLVKMLYWNTVTVSLKCMKNVRVVFDISSINVTSINVTLPSAPRGGPRGAEGHRGPQHQGPRGGAEGHRGPHRGPQGPEGGPVRGGWGPQGPSLVREMPHWCFGLFCWFMNVALVKSFMRTVECRFKCIDLFCVEWVIWMQVFECYSDCIIQVRVFFWRLIPYWPIQSKHGELAFNQDPLWWTLWDSLDGLWVRVRVRTGRVHPATQSQLTGVIYTRDNYNPGLHPLLFYFFLLGPKVMSFMWFLCFMWFIRYKVKVDSSGQTKRRGLSNPPSGSSSPTW